MFVSFKSCSLAAMVFLVLTGCSKNNSNPQPTPPGSPTPTAPTMGSTSTGSVARTYAVVSGTISSTGNATISAKGFCWSKTPNVSLSNSFMVSNVPGNTFTDTIKGLAYNTTYYLRAYATNSVGTTYGTEISLITPNTSFTIGQLYQGGKIFHIDSTGEHGYIWPGSYSYTHYPWAAWPYIDTRIGTTKFDIGSGRSNTTLILASGNNAANTAAAVCENYIKDGFSDWFLPSIGELGLLKQAVSLFDISGSLYWSSSETLTGNYVYLQAINGVASFGYDTKDMSWGVIPIRAY